MEGRMSMGAKLSEDQSGLAFAEINTRRLKAGTKVRSTVETLFGTVKPGDVVTIVRSCILGGGLYIVDASDGQATLSVDEFTVLEAEED